MPRKILKRVKKRTRRRVPQAMQSQVRTLVQLTVHNKSANDED